MSNLPKFMSDLRDLLLEKMKGAMIKLDQPVGLFFRKRGLSLESYIIGGVLVALSLPGILIMSAFSANDLSSQPDNTTPKRTLFITVALQLIFIVAICAAIGIYLGAKVGLDDPFLSALSQGQWLWSTLWDQLLIGIVVGAVCAVVWMACYYGFIRSRIDRESVLISEELRFQLGIAARVTSGGITEEIMFRWGLLSLIMWLLNFLVSSEAVAFWIAIVLSGVLFGLAHLPGNFSRGCKPSKMLISSAVLGNLWVAICCGYLFWQYGIIAAIAVHIVFHLVWYPWDRVAYRKLQAQAQTAAA